MKKKIAIVGGGFTGLSCGVNLINQGFEVTILESRDQSGGLALGFKPAEWLWSLEIFYHHIFTGDKEIIDLAKRVDEEIIFVDPLTTSLYHLKETQLDSPVSLLKFSGISFWSRVRMGIGLAILKIIPNGLFLEKYQATDALPRLLGQEGYKAVWKKLLSAKFGPFVDHVNMAWFWSRVAKRSKSLGYFKEGFQGLANKVTEYIEKKGGKIIFGRKVEKVTGWIETEMDRHGSNTKLAMTKRGVMVDGERFDAVVITTPAPIIKKLIPDVEFPKLDHLWGQTLILELSQKLIKGYWMNILEESWPFLVMVDHTNFIDKKYYGGNRIVYLGNYLPEGHKQLKMTKEKLLDLYSPFIKKIHKGFSKKRVKRMFLFREPFAQPVFPINYSAQIPRMRTATEGVYIANMSMVYPFDRGTNYAVKLGRDVATMVIGDLQKK